MMRPARAPDGAELLFEIGTEELPAAYLPGLIDQLREAAQRLLREAHLTHGRVDVFGTPRRLVLLVHDLASIQRRPAEEIRGPSKQAAFDAHGKPTPALTGFLRSRKGTLAQTKIVGSGKGEYVYLVTPASSVSTVSVLPAWLPLVVGALRAPKSMRWDATDVRFARPIRWLLALYGTTPIRVALGRLRAEPRTWFGGPKTPRPAPVTSVSDYLTALKKAGVILDHAQRRAVIQSALTRLVGEAGGTVAPEMISHGLLDEVTFLVEEPVPLVGGFDERYLTLPREVLLASMAKHQRVFAMEQRGRLLPRFIAILEGKPGKPALVRQVAERILNARLADSLLFLTEDRGRLPLEQMAAALSGVTFHEKLGSMADKTVRLRGLAEPIAEAWKLSQDDTGHLRRACQLAKADLVSTMVKEFPTLQGVVGKYYARDSNEPEEVAAAIEEHYLPAGGRLPTTAVGRALAILDKYDTLTGYFGLGIEPTGDQDPFGLRRAAQGIVEVAWAAHRPLPLDRLLRVRGSLPPFTHAQPKDIAVVGERVRRYLWDRLYTFAWPAPAPSADCIDAVLASGGDDLVDLMERIRSLRTLTGNPGLLRAAKVIERTRNILRGAPLRQPAVEPDRLREPLERRLWDLYGSHHQEIERLTDGRDYAAATTRFGEVFFDPIHEFFEHVLVNVPDEALQQNRLALMKAINTLYTARIADLSKLTILQREEHP